VSVDDLCLHGYTERIFNFWLGETRNGLSPTVDQRYSMVWALPQANILKIQR